MKIFAMYNATMNGVKEPVAPIASSQRIYFDNAATTALDKEVLDAMLPYMTEHFGNPSSIYSYGRETRLAIENARKSVARNLGVKPGSIFFTSGGTESIALAIQGAVAALDGAATLIVSAIEHDAATKAAACSCTDAGVPESASACSTTNPVCRCPAMNAGCAITRAR